MIAGPLLPPLKDWPGDLALCVRFFTRLPVPDLTEERLLARAVYMFPVGGLIAACPPMLTLFVAWAAGADGSIAAILALAAGIIATGGLHEDGLADSADALGGADRDERLALMRDSRIGAYGVMALTVALLLKATALAVLFEGGPGRALAALAAAAAISRAVMGGMTGFLKPARADGLAGGFGSPAILRVYAGFALGAVLAAAPLLGLFGPIAALVVAVTAVVVFLFCCRLARRWFGGYTGDVLGGCQQLCEVAVLVALTLGL